jgi:hypothetical protein
VFVFNQFGDLERCALRSGNVASAHEWRSVLEPVVSRYRNNTKRRLFRGGAAFAAPHRDSRIASAATPKPAVASWRRVFLGIPTPTALKTLPHHERLSDYAVRCSSAGTHLGNAE